MWFSVFVIFTVFSSANARNAPLVKTNHGTVRGKWLSGARNVSVAAYLGIPYAEPPIDELRFESPHPWKEVWTDVRDATEDGPMCVQSARDGTVKGSEDCLFLNIFVPLVSPNRNLPVLVFVHGGGFTIGSNNSTYFAPDYLADREIILVTINYRLSIFGFLSTATENVSGNAGLKDIREALRWVENNIMTFGGDPNATTLVGQSAGAAAVHHLALSQTTEGLFDKYVTHSGSAVAPWAIHPPFAMRMKYLVIARELGCTTDYDTVDFEQYLVNGFDRGDDEMAYNQATQEDEQILRCLRQINPTRLATAEHLLHAWKMNPWCNFGPTTEVPSDDAIITKHPVRTIEQRGFRDIPWINGVVEDEGLLKTIELFLNRDLMKDFVENFENVGTHFLESDEIIENSTLFTRALSEFYFTKGIEAALDEVSNYNLTMMIGDGLITWPSYRATKIQSELMNAPVYFYLFSYEGTFSITYVDGIPLRYGVAHTDDLNYLFPCLNNKYADLQLHNTGSDWTMVNIMTELWSNFAETGIPSARQTVDWDPFQVNNSFMRIGSGRSPEMALEHDFLSERMNFWEYLMGNLSRPFEELFSEEGEGSGDVTEDESASTASATQLRTFNAEKVFFISIIYTVRWY